MSVAAVDGTEGMELRLQEKPPQNCSVVSPNNRKLVKTIQIQEKSEKWKNCGTDCLAKTRTVQSATTAPGTLGLKQSWIVQPRAHCRYDFLGRWMKGQKACKFQIFGRQEECEFSILHFTGMIEKLSSQLQCSWQAQLRFRRRWWIEVLWGLGCFEAGHVKNEHTIDSNCWSAKKSPLSHFSLITGKVAQENWETKRNAFKFPEHVEFKHHN